MPTFGSISKATGSTGGGGDDDQTLAFSAATNLLTIEDGNTVDLSDLETTEATDAFGDLIPDS